MGPMCVSGIVAIWNLWFSRIQPRAHFDSSQWTTQPFVSSIHSHDPPTLNVVTDKRRQPGTRSASLLATAVQRLRSFL
jgi:hypothetical protein